MPVYCGFIRGADWIRNDLPLTCHVKFLKAAVIDTIRGVQ